MVHERRAVRVFDIRDVRTRHSSFSAPREVLISLSLTTKRTMMYSCLYTNTLSLLVDHGPGCFPYSLETTNTVLRPQFRQQRQILLSGFRQPRHGSLRQARSPILNIRDGERHHRPPRFPRLDRVALFIHHRRQHGRHDRPGTRPADTRANSWPRLDQHGTTVGEDDPVFGAPKAENLYVCATGYRRAAG